MTFPRSRLTLKLETFYDATKRRETVVGAVKKNSILNAFQSVYNKKGEGTNVSSVANLWRFIVQRVTRASRERQAEGKALWYSSPLISSRSLTQHTFPAAVSLSGQT